jgi:Fe-S oxidoreductase
MPAAELTGQPLFDALDLCVECKACKAECPSGVDMARMKYEVLTRYNEANGTPLRSRIFARIRLLSRLAAPFGPVLNRANRVRPLRRLLERYGGIHSERPLPAFASQTFPAWFGRHKTEAARTTPRGEAVYFHDTFTDYYHPEAGIAAVRVLEALGYEVVLVERTECCGRPAISKGMLPLAREWARGNIARLAPFARRGVPIVGTEPSCLLTLRDEYPELVRTPEAAVVAAEAVLLDELVSRLAKDDPSVRSLFRDDMKQRVVLHTHCHQKALAGSEPSVEALGLVAGYSVELVDSGCCGMAGSFGFEKEHYEISRAMGALRLFPAVEAAGPDATVAITGVSCRQQIGHFTSRTPRHSAELLAEALK